MPITDKQRAINRAYYAKHGERLRAAQRARNAANPQYAVEYTKKWRIANPERHRALNRRSHFVCSYGLTPEQIDAMSAAQNHCCGICGEPFGQGMMQRSVDHDHETNVIRGLLHGKCNTAIGKLGDSVEGVQRALDYLIRARTSQARV